MNLRHACGWRLFDGDGIAFRRRIIGFNAVCQILANSTVAVADHQNLKTMFVVGCPHCQWLVDKPSIQR